MLKKARKYDRHKGGVTFKLNTLMGHAVCYDASCRSKYKTLEKLRYCHKGKIPCHINDKFIPQAQNLLSA